MCAVGAVSSARATFRQLNLSVASSTIKNMFFFGQQSYRAGDWNLQEWKMTDQQKKGVEFAGLENEGLEIDGLENDGLENDGVDKTKRMHSKLSQYCLRELCDRQR